MSKSGSFSTTITSLFITAAISLLLIWIMLERVSTSDRIKQEIGKLQKYLVESGYDMSYEELNFSKLPFFTILTVKDLKIYSQDSNDYFEWHIPELRIDPDLFSLNKLSFKLSDEQTFQKGTEVYNAKFPRLSLTASFNKASGLNNISLVARGLDIDRLFSIEEIKFASQRMSPQTISELTPFFESHMEMKGLDFASNQEIPISKRIEHLYFNANIKGVIKDEDSYQKSISSWLNMGGMIEIKRITMNWEPLTLVGRGDLYFNEELDPNLHLATSSKGLLETIDSFQERGMLDNKGVFVSKVLLGNKAFLLNEKDEHKTVTTPIDLRDDTLSVENVAIKKF